MMFVGVANHDGVGEGGEVQERVRDLRVGWDVISYEVEVGIRDDHEVWVVNDVILDSELVWSSEAFIEKAQNLLKR